MKTQFFHKMKYDLKGHPRSYKTTFMQNHSSTFVYGPILMKICMNADIIKMQYMTWIVTFCFGEVLWIFLLRPSDLITNLTYVLMDNFCPCFFHHQGFAESKNNWHPRDKLFPFSLFISLPLYLSSLSTFISMYLPWEIINCCQQFDLELSSNNKVFFFNFSYKNYFIMHFFLILHY
jgi:hypothetical protein